jgi:hypothetical protein
VNNADASRRRSPSKPAYDLSGFKSGRLVITDAAARRADHLGMSAAEMKAALARSEPAHFCKSMPAEPRKRSA